MRLVRATVGRVLSQADGVQRLELECSVPGVAEKPAICYEALTGACEAGDEVVVNTTAADLALGTGGVHFVVVRLRGGGVLLDDPADGHIMKLRYTPLQRDVLSVEEPASPDHEVMRTAEDVAGMPVVCCGLHSQVAIVAAAVKRVAPDATIAYVMTDDAALPLALSDLVRDCRAAGLLDTTVTAGQAFGGELEAVNVHSALLAAAHVTGADVTITSIGPGVVGTATPFGHGGVGQGEALNAAAALGGVPVAVLRVSFADERERHQGVSHHSLTALARIATARCRVPVPTLSADETARIMGMLDSAGVTARHEVVEVACELPDMRGVSVRTMGRGPAEDRAFFLAATAAGELAARMCLQGDPED